ncbi:zinc-binding dehydrogenase [Streptomyces sp. UNOC14_S4]|nr:zinc-binding dehydrogenase [Streptomyces sp. UNOC14_S4]
MESYGEPEVLAVGDVREPELRHGHRRIEVSLAGVNFADLHVRDNSYLAGVPLPYIPGNEVVGRIADTGERVAALTAGGGYAEVAQARRLTTMPIPDDIDDATALALTLQGQSAWHLLHTVLRLQPGETVIIPAAAGGVGSLAVQLAKRVDARVVALAGTESKRALARDLGADVTVDSTSTTLADDLKDAVDGAADAALEMTGGATLRATMDALRPFGRMVVYGGVSGVETPVSTRDLMATGKAVQGFWLPLLYGQRNALKGAAEDLFAAIRSSEIRIPKVDVYPLAEVARAHEDLAARRTVGKTALDPSL